MAEDGTMDDLKPCPFCGGEADIESTSAYASVYCDDCGGQSEVHSSEAEAIAAWNARTTPPGYALVKLEGAEERVARAIYEVDPATEMKALDDWGDEHVLEPISWENAPEIPDEKYDVVFDYAQAAIKALTEE